LSRSKEKAVLRKKILEGTEDPESALKRPIDQDQKDKKKVKRRKKGKQTGIKDSRKNLLVKALVRWVQRKSLTFTKRILSNRKNEGRVTEDEEPTRLMGAMYRKIKRGLEKNEKRSSSPRDG